LSARNQRWSGQSQTLGPFFWATTRKKTRFEIVQAFILLVLQDWSPHFSDKRRLHPLCLRVSGRSYKHTHRFSA